MVMDIFQVCSVRGWLGDSLIVGDQDCDDTVVEQYPGAVAQR